jgi:hypothetical protein
MGRSFAKGNGHWTLIGYCERERRSFCKRSRLFAIHESAEQANETEMR